MGRPASRHDGDKHAEARYQGLVALYALSSNHGVDQDDLPPPYRGPCIGAALRLVAEASREQIPLSARLAVFYDLATAGSPGQAKDDDAYCSLAETAAQQRELPDEAITADEPLRDIAAAAEARGPLYACRAAQAFAHHEPPSPASASAPFAASGRAGFAPPGSTPNSRPTPPPRTSRTGSTPAGGRRSYTSADLVTDTQWLSWFAKDWARAWTNWSETVEEAAREGLDAGATPPGASLEHGRGTVSTLASPAAKEPKGYVLAVTGLAADECPVCSDIASIDQGAANIPAADVALAVAAAAGGARRVRLWATNASAPHGLYGTAAHSCEPGADSGPALRLGATGV